MIGGGELGCGAGVAEGRFSNRVGGGRVSEVQDGVALLIGKVDGEIGIDGSLAGIGERAFGVLHGEAGKELGLAGEFMVDARGELIGNGGDFR